MTTRAVARFTRGETFTCALEATAGDPTGATCRVVLKAAVFNQPPGDAAADAAVLTVTPAATVDALDAEAGPGWVLTLSAEDSEALTAGRYLMDARVELGGVVAQTDLVEVTVDERVTEAA